MPVLCPAISALATRNQNIFLSNIHIREMSCITRDDNLPPVTSGRFSYGINGLKFNNVSRIPPDLLKDMFVPKRGQSKTDTRGYKMSKKDIEAQLQLYGVARSGMRNMRVAEMRDTLAEMVKNGKCNSPTEEITNLETSLKDQYTALNTPHIESLIKTRQAEFDAITDPTSAANFSIPLFLRRYFLNDDGTPDPTKTTHAIALPGFNNRGMMHEAASKIEGLNTHSDGREPNRILAIGWDRTAVWKAASGAAAEGYREREVELKEESNARMQEHREFLESIESKKKTGKSGGKTSKDFDLLQVAGRYLVECKAIEEEWPDQAENGLYMKIVPDRENKGRMVAEFEFGILEGVMRFVQVGEKHLADGDHGWASDSGESTEVDSYRDEEEEGDDDDNDNDALTTSFMPDDINIYESKNRKRKLQSSPPAAKEPDSQSAKSQPTKPAAPQVKKTRLSDTEKFKLLFLWRGRDTGTGEIQIDPDRSNKGFIEFENPECVTFTGVMDAPFFTKGVLKGFKVARDDGKGIVNHWKDFSKKVYEHERVNRWR